MLLLQLCLAMHAFVYATDQVSYDASLLRRSPFPKWLRLCSKEWLAGNAGCSIGSFAEPWCVADVEDYDSGGEPPTCGTLYALLSGYQEMPGYQLTLSKYVTLLFGLVGAPFLLLVRCVEETWEALRPCVH